MAMLAAQQYGIVTREQLHYLGYSTDAVDRMVAVGRLHPWHRSVFAVGHHGLSAHGLCMATVLFRGGGAMISHQSAVWLWGLERKLEIPVHVSVRRRERTAGGVGLHHCPSLRDEDVTETERLAVTAVPRTLLDYASEAQQPRLERAIDRADRLELLDLAAIDRLADEVGAHRGRGPLLRAMAAFRESGFTKSGGEKRMLAALDDAGIRRPLINNSVGGYQLAFYWEQERLAVELDSWEHRGRRSFEDDRRRQEELAVAGIETIRVTGTRLRREPRKVARRIGSHLARRHQSLAA